MPMNELMLDFKAYYIDRVIVSLGTSFSVVPRPYAG